ncbi:tRNA lysidine(34) synthetase TilS [Pseudoclavibacter soli]|uniref:tRNA lysidine(34) synthetase TilS n=1 Tax=Pseudoclavibacter soli TaxID=452623 RepID=UPI00040ED4D2|nr:tRNA lysidine(34) synthetase TilS [Pseudoclavibacter soli]
MAVPERRPRLDAATGSIRHQVRLLLQQQHPTAVLVALSGGADSVALTAAVAHVAPKLGVRWHAVTVDHQLQPGSAEVAERARRTAAHLGASTAAVLPVEVASGGSLEEQARVARYAALERQRQRVGADLVLVAHTLDDQAETVLLGLARGSGTRSLAGMRRVSGTVARPLLGVRRELTRASCHAQGLPVWDDPQNLDPAFLRVRLRQHVLPMLERELGGGVAAALARTAAQAADDDDLLSQLAGEALERVRADDGALDVAALQALPAALATRVIKDAVGARCGRGLSARHVHEVYRLVCDWCGQGPIDVPGGQVRRDRGRLVIATKVGNTTHAEEHTEHGTV